MRGIPPAIIILAIFLLIIQTLWPVLLAVIVVIVAFAIYNLIKENKRQKQLEEQRKIDEAKKELERQKSEKIKLVVDKCSSISNSFDIETIKKEEVILTDLLSKVPITTFDTPFIDVKVKKQQLKIAIITLASDIISKIENNLFENDLIDRLDQYIKEYGLVSGYDGRIIGDKQKEKFNDLCDALQKLEHRTYVNITTNSAIDSLNLCYGQRTKYKYNRSTYMCVGASLKPIQFSYDGISIYLYPDYIVVVKNGEFRIHLWNNISFKTEAIKAYSKGYSSNVLGAEILYSMYEHTRVDGTPDRRFKNSQLYHLLRLYKLHCNNIPNLNFIIANQIEAKALEKLFIEYSLLFQSTTDTIQPEVENQKEFIRTLEDEVKSIISNNGINIILEKKFLHLLADSKVCYKETNALAILRHFFEDSILLDIYYSEIAQERRYEIPTEYYAKYKYDSNMTKVILELMIGVINDFK